MANPNAVGDGGRDHGHGPAGGSTLSPRAPASPPLGRPRQGWRVAGAPMAPAGRGTPSFSPACPRAGWHGRGSNPMDHVQVEGHHLAPTAHNARLQEWGKAKEEWNKVLW